MTLNDIIKKLSKLISYEKGNFNLELTKKTFNTIDLCINKNIKYELTEDDFIRIINMYYELHHKYDFNYFKIIASNSNSTLDYEKVFKKINNI